MLRFLSVSALLLSSSVLASPLPASGPGPRLAPVFDRCMGKKQIALTYDDGPFENLPLILDVLKANGAKATFYVNGQNYGSIRLPSRLEALKRAIAEGSEVANHGYSHKNSESIGKDKTKEEILELDKIFAEYGIKAVRDFRPPFGAYDDDTRAAIAEAGYSRMVMWSADTNDWKTDSTPQKSLDAVKDAIKATPDLSPIVLAHEPQKDIVEFTKMVVKWGIDEGYKFVTVAECLGSSAPTVPSTPPPPPPAPTTTAVPVPPVATTPPAPTNSPLPPPPANPPQPPAPTTPANPPSNPSTPPQPPANPPQPPAPSNLSTPATPETPAAPSKCPPGWMLAPKP